MITFEKTDLKCSVISVHFGDKKTVTYLVLMFFKGSLVEKLHFCVRDDWRKYRKIPRDKWRLFYFNIVNSKQFNMFLTFIILLNVCI
jgi:hypothetical protein